MSQSNVLTVPRGKDGLPPLSLEMGEIYSAEKRLKELAYVTPSTSGELRAYFNEMTNNCTKYIAWIAYEVVVAEKRFSDEKARVILEVLPEEVVKLKETGLKPNDDWREAIVTRDEGCRKAKDIIDMLKAVQKMLENRAKTFERAYFSAIDTSEKRGRVAATPNLNGTIGQLSEPQNNFMGTSQMNGDY